MVIGHSERRQYFGETDETVNQRRTRAALDAGMTVILCVGELFKSSGSKASLRKLCAMQTKAGAAAACYQRGTVRIIDRLRARMGDRHRQNRHALNRPTKSAGSIRVLRGGALRRQMWPKSMTIQYGGSMNAKNAAELLCKAAMWTAALSAAHL